MAMLGRPPSVRPSVRAKLAEPLRQKPGRLHLIRAEVWRDDRGTLWARMAGRQGAGMIHSLARAQAWAVVPPDVSELPRGSEVDVRLLVEVP
jgi:molybdopterin molybdotransferase